MMATATPPWDGLRLELPHIGRGEAEAMKSSLLKALEKNGQQLPRDAVFIEIEGPGIFLVVDERKITNSMGIPMSLIAEHFPTAPLYVFSKDEEIPN